MMWSRSRPTSTRCAPCAVRWHAFRPNRAVGVGSDKPNAYVHDAPCVDTTAAGGNAPCCGRGVHKLVTDLSDHAGVKVRYKPASREEPHPRATAGESPAGTQAVWPAQ